MDRDKLRDGLGKWCHQLRTGELDGKAAYADQLIAFLEEAGALQYWRPIEEAPRKGQFCLVEMHHRGEKWTALGSAAPHGMQILWPSLDGTPKSFMPLPSPPESEG